MDLKLVISWGEIQKTVKAVKHAGNENCTQTFLFVQSKSGLTVLFGLAGREKNVFVNSLSNVDILS